MPARIPATLLCMSVVAFSWTTPVRGDDPPADSRAVGIRRSTFVPVADKTGHAGLFVGVNVFPEENSLTSLNFAVNDAVCLAHLFVLELKLIQPDRATLALSGAPTGDAVAQLAALKSAGVTVTEATKIRVLRALQRTVSLPTDAADLIVVGISTHGFEENGVAYVMPADGACKFLKDTAVSLTTIKETLAESKAGKRLLCIDACRDKPITGSKAGPAAMSRVFHDDLAKASGQGVLAACDVGQVSWENAAVGNGVFTHYLLEALRGKARPDALGLIRVDEVARYVSTEVAAWSRQNTKALQQPWFEGPEVARQIPLAVDPAAAGAVRDRLKRLREVFLRGEIEPEQMREAERLLTSGATSDSERKRLSVYEKLADGKTDPETARMALSAMPVGVGRPEPSRPAATRVEPVRPVDGGDSGPALSLDLGGGVKLECVLIPKGEFDMGSPDKEEDHQSDESPVHRVRIGQAFYMGKYEVTNGQFRHFKSDHNSGEFQGVSLNGDEQPVVRVSWEDAQAFCRWLSSKSGKTVRLPSEAEWEYACRSGDGRVFPWGNTWPPPNGSGNYADETAKGKFSSWGIIGGYRDGYAGTGPVGSFSSNRFGLHDMGGNVWEWCEDWYHDKYDGAPTDGSAWLSGGEQKARVLRGGSWDSDVRRYLRSANRVRRTPGLRGLNNGFRVVVASGTP